MRSASEGANPGGAERQTTLHTHSITILLWQPPLRCDACRRRADVFASRAGWRCWPCLPPADRCDDRGQTLPAPEITLADRRALTAVRRQLAARKKAVFSRTNFQPA